MRRKGKIMIIGFALIAIVLIAFSMTHWNNKIDNTTEKAKEKIEITKKTDPSLTGDGPVGGNEFTNRDENEQADSTGSDQPTTNGGVVPNEQEGNSGVFGVGTNSVTGSPGAGKTLEEIKADYQTVFTDLEVQESSIIDQLVVQAKADYVSEKYTKEDLAMKYQDAATELEKNADNTFNMLYKQLEMDLEKYGYDKNEAAPFRTEYQAKKQERLTHVITELQNF